MTTTRRPAEASYKPTNGELEASSGVILARRFAITCPQGLDKLSTYIVPSDVIVLVPNSSPGRTPVTAWNAALPLQKLSRAEGSGFRHKHQRITSIYLPIYLFVCLSIYRSIYLSIHTYIPTYRHTCIPTYLHTYVPAYLHAYIHTYIHTCIHASIHMCGVCIYIYIYIFTYTHYY